MPFWRKEKRDSNGGGGENGEEKVNYKARLEHKQYLVSQSECAI